MSASWGRAPSCKAMKQRCQTRVSNEALQYQDTLRKERYMMWSQR
jgi:hypothetical protein